MQHFILQKHTDNTKIFEGYYISFIECLEDAVNKEIDLNHINLKNKNLSNANLDSAYMPHALLCGSNLTGANLSEAILSGSIFYNCTLYNTCLSYSNLCESDFRSTSFGATLIEGANIQNCIFSTLSCFELDFGFTQNMEGCLFSSPDSTLHEMSNPPVIIKGFMNKDIIILDNIVKVGANIFPKTILPAIIKTLESCTKQPFTNKGKPFLEWFKKAENLA